MVSVKVGLIARAENRGLGHLTREWYRHMRPDKTLVVVPAGVSKAGLTSHFDWYPDATHARFLGRLTEHLCREWLEGLDVVYSAETFYDWRFCRWARQAGVATVCHLMPEWLPTGRTEEPDAWWAPTSWRLDHCPPGTKVVPVPIATDRFTPTEPSERPFRWLHVAGARTHGDRNGTGAVLDAARLLHKGSVTVRSQSPGLRSTERVTVDTGDVTHYWNMYDGFDGLVMPRRYAGLSLPVLEAFGKGLPVVMTDMSPQNTDWPVCTVPTLRGFPLKMMGGLIETGDAEVHDLAAMMNSWAEDPTAVNPWRTASRHYAAANSWDVRAPELLAELAEVADRAPVGLRD